MPPPLPLMNGDGASSQEDGDDASLPSDSSSVAHHSHSEDATADNDTDNNDDTDLDDGVDSEQESETMDVATDDELQEEHAADEQNSLQSDNDAGSVNNDTMEDQDQPAIKSESEEDETSLSPSLSLIKLGGRNGSNGTPAYALLVGIMDPDISDSNEIISIPITRLPTTLGKEHTTKDPSFVGLKESISNNNDTSENNYSPKLSQSMCCIFYRDAHGGKLGLYKKGRKKENDTAGDEKGEKGAVDPLDGMIYKPCENYSNIGDDNTEKSSSSAPSPDNDILRLPDMDSKAPLPTSGFFAIECTGRKIMVGGRVIKKGQVAMLKDGMPIKIASHCFYFLLPKTSTSSSSLKPPPSIKVKLATATPIKLEKIISDNPEKKERESIISGGSNEKDDYLSLSPPPPTKKPRKSEDFVSSFDDKSDQQLLQLLSLKVTHTSWDHEGQKLGSTLATRVCRAAAKSTAIQTIVLEEGGVTQREIIDWMNDPASVYKDYERMMLAQIVEKSFMMSMGKAILRAGYTKNEYLSGRAFRWNLPEDIPLCHLSKKEKQVSPSSSLSGMKDSEESNLALEKALENTKEENVKRSNNISSQQDDGGDDSENMDLSDENSEEGVEEQITSPDM